MSNFKYLNIMAKGVETKRLVNFDLVTEIIPPHGKISYSTICFNMVTGDGHQDTLATLEPFGLLIEMSRETTTSNMLQNVYLQLSDMTDNLACIASS